MTEPDQALVPVETSKAPDPYERDYMKGQGAVLYRDKMVSGAKFNAFLATMGAVVIGIGALQGTMIPALTVLPLLALLWIFFGVIRVTVSEEALSIQYGLIGPTIPMHAIESATAIQYKWTSVGGYGIRRAPDGWMYNMMGDGGNAVKVVWHDAKGKRKVTYVGTKTAEKLAEEISRGRAALQAAQPQRELRASAREPDAE